MRKNASRLLIFSLVILVLSSCTATTAPRNVASLLIAKNCKQLVFHMDCSGSNGATACFGMCNSRTPPGGPYGKPGIACVPDGCQCTYCS
ncbi:hypothetical protein PVAP13_3KG063908 [Panicum virgatum]|uniref:Uncharacterized protein n=1 Tax=Panicum virgatum TaxID=38727 RepID=A0A8T0UMF7_PANVG|nr:hypothetical protein PVAP13_3KG063908 [Panicum virgatum]